MIYFGLIVVTYFSYSFCKCPKESVEWQNDCYFFNKTATAFAISELNCIKLGGHVTAIHDGFTNTLLAAEGMQHFTNDSMPEFWIGLTNLKTQNSNFTWIDGTLLDFTEWSTEQPAVTVSHNCTTFSINTGQWKTEDCLKEKPFVCKVQKIKFPDCPPFYTYFEPTQACYGVGYGVGLRNWSEAENFCNSYGGHLPSIHSTVEFKLLQTFANYGVDPWSGLYSVDDGKSWAWNDGSAFDFNSWANEMPISEKSNCSYFSPGGMINDSCDKNYAVLCKNQL